MVADQSTISYSSLVVSLQKLEAEMLSSVVSWLQISPPSVDQMVLGAEPRVCRLDRGQMRGARYAQDLVPGLTPIDWLRQCAS